MQNPITRILIFFAAVVFSFSCNPSKKITSAGSPNKFAQLDSIMNAMGAKPKEYQPSSTREFDLLHTKLEVKFDWSKEQLNGKATLTLKPYFYPSNILTLDAKYFDIHKVVLMKNGTSKNSGDSLISLNFTYDSLKMNISLGQEFSRNDTVRLLIDYTAKPNEVKQKGSGAIRSAKGLYFINADGKDKYKPKQVWTQGETESSSCWFPTIDKPNERTTQEMYITVDTNFTTLSNGSFGYSSFNKDGTRTDYWKMDLPHAPYLFMMAVGEYAIIKDKWKNMEVNYYVEKDYKDDAKAIFGNTPEMLEFFSDKLGVDYPWQKYSQIIVRDYVSGAMENTTATIHGEFVQRTKRELIDGDEDDIIAHELFHHWFGDLVTCESWSNLPLNESFANYSEYLWREYKQGKMEADYLNSNDLRGYLKESEKKKEQLIRYYYSDKEDMFDRHSYEKGGRVLHMLRNLVGDEAFFKSLQLYLTANKFKSAEIHHLRLAFEETTGLDLNWFFNQWFLTPGHPKLEISYDYDETAKTSKVTIRQTQDLEKSSLFRIPMAVDIYQGGKIKREKILLEDKEKTFSFSADTKPDLINVDADKILLCEKQNNQSPESFAFQFRNAPLFVDKLEAINFFEKKQNTELGKEVYLLALNEKFWGIKQKVIPKLKLNDTEFRNKLKPLLVDLAQKDITPSVRVAALEKLTEYEDSALVGVFVQAANDSSIEVIYTAMDVLKELDTAKALQLVRKFENDKSKDIQLTLLDVYATQSDAKYAVYFEKAFETMGGFYKYALVMSYGAYLMKTEDEKVMDKGLELLNKEATENKQHWMRATAESVINNIKIKLESKRENLKSKLKNSDSASTEHSVLQTRLDKLNSRIDSIEKMLKEIKEKEKKS